MLYMIGDNFIAMNMLKLVLRKRDFEEWNVSYKCK